MHALYITSSSSSRFLFSVPIPFAWRLDCCRWSASHNLSTLRVNREPGFLTEILRHSSARRSRTLHAARWRIEYRGVSTRVNGLDTIYGFTPGAYREDCRSNRYSVEPLTKIRYHESNHFIVRTHCEYCPPACMLNIRSDWFCLNPIHWVVFIHIQWRHPSRNAQ